MDSVHLTRSQFEYKCTIRDNKIKMEADVYSCKSPMHMTMNNPDGHKYKHGLGANPGNSVSGQEYNMVFVMRGY